MDIKQQLVLNKELNKRRPPEDSLPETEEELVRERTVEQILCLEEALESAPPQIKADIQSFIETLKKKLTAN